MQTKTTQEKPEEALTHGKVAKRHTRNIGLKLKNVQENISQIVENIQDPKVKNKFKASMTNLEKLVSQTSAPVAKKVVDPSKLFGFNVPWVATDQTREFLKSKGDQSGTVSWSKLTKMINEHIETNKLKAQGSDEILPDLALKNLLKYNASIHGRITRKKLQKLMRYCFPSLEGKNVSCDWN